MRAASDQGAPHANTQLHCSRFALQNAISARIKKTGEFVILLLISQGKNVIPVLAEKGPSQAGGKCAVPRGPSAGAFSALGLRR